MGEGGWYQVRGQLAGHTVVEGDDIVAQLAQEGERAWELRIAGWGPGDVEIME